MRLTRNEAPTRRHVLRWMIAAGALPGVLPCAAWARRDGLPVMLAGEAPADIDPAGWLVSEKFDGVRAVWDGRQLLFRSGQPVAAPDWFRSRLPATPLDGELWLDRGRFEALVGIVRRHRPVDAEWHALRYQVFDLPADAGRFAERAVRIAALAREVAWPQLQAVAQQRIDSRAALARRLDEVLRGGGEGLVLHRADALWRPGRSGELLKLKPIQDAEALVIGHLPGHGRYAGQLGALCVRLDDGTDFLIGTGFSDADRAAPPAVGTWVSFSYRGRTAAGVPRFASFLRVREL